MTTGEKTSDNSVENQSEMSQNIKTIHTSNHQLQTYLKAMPLRKLSDLDRIKGEIDSGNILIIKVTPLANKSIDDIRKAINELCNFVKTVNGDIARLGEERIVITPSNIRIWREKTNTSEEQVPTAA